MYIPEILGSKLLAVTLGVLKRQMNGVFALVQKWHELIFVPSLKIFFGFRRLLEPGCSALDVLIQLTGNLGIYFLHDPRDLFAIVERSLSRPSRQVRGGGPGGWMFRLLTSFGIRNRRHDRGFHLVKVNFMKVLTRNLELLDERFQPFPRIFIIENSGLHFRIFHRFPR